MKQQDLSDNQARFNQEAALYESEQEPLLTRAQSRVQHSMSPVAKIGLVLGGLGLILIIVLAILRPGSTPTQPKVEPQPSPTQIQVKPQLSPLQQQVKELRQQLQQADPANKETPFPQINAEIRIEPVESE
jgi:hypothetical protein